MLCNTVYLNFVSLFLNFRNVVLNITSSYVTYRLLQCCVARLATNVIAKILSDAEQRARSQAV